MSLASFFEILQEYWLPPQIEYFVGHYGRQFEYYLHRYNLEKFPLDLSHVKILPEVESDYTHEKTRSTQSQGEDYEFNIDLLDSRPSTKVSLSATNEQYLSGS